MGILSRYYLITRSIQKISLRHLVVVNTQFYSNKEHNRKSRRDSRFRVSIIRVARSIPRNPGARLDIDRVVAFLRAEINAAIKKRIVAFVRNFEFLHAQFL